MNIKKIRDIFKRDREVSLSYLSRETGESSEDLLFIIKDWMAKGKIKQVVELPSCGAGGCAGCAEASLAANTDNIKKYRWV